MYSTDHLDVLYACMYSLDRKHEHVVTRCAPCLPVPVHLDYPKNAKVISFPPFDKYKQNKTCTRQMHKLWSVKVDGGNGKEIYGEDYADIWAINRLHFKAGNNKTCDHVS